MKQLPYGAYEAKVNGIPCWCVVTEFNEDDFDFELYDRKGYRAKWLEGKATYEDAQELQWAYQGHMDAKWEV